jgi:hypothetical protein
VARSAALLRARAHPACAVWHQKGHKPQGKSEFLAAAAPLVKVSLDACVSRAFLTSPTQFLEEQSDDEE